MHEEITAQAGITPLSKPDGNIDILSQEVCAVFRNLNSYVERWLLPPKRPEAGNEPVCCKRAEGADGHHVEIVRPL